jgi:hypothetical protein
MTTLLLTIAGAEPVALVEESRKLLSRTGASSGSVHVRAGQHAFCASCVASRT